METQSSERMITYTASLELSVADTEETRSILLEQIKNNNGFVVRETNNFIITRIPSENMDTFLQHARTLGEVENETRTGTDITDQYQDNVMRLENFQNVRDRYLALLDHAITVSDILAIERELERINLQIETLKGKIRHAELSVAYSNITIRFRIKEEQDKVRLGPVSWIFYGLYHGVKLLFVW
ncbi:MAG: DUF4349 domain-containing protein [Chitinispirillales bacterium]|jgi:hypothetical protein|nr:DUF4349 domain-containing protein [Chitinispirillales bacterium]